MGGETAEPSQQAAGKASLKPARSPLGVRIKGTLRDIETLSIRSLFKRTRNRVKGPLVFLILTTPPNPDHLTYAVASTTLNQALNHEP